MILKFFKRGTGNTCTGESVENYLLDDERQEKEQAQAVHRRQNRSNRTGRAGTGIPYTGDRRQQSSHAGDRAKR